MKAISLEELLEAGCHFGHQVTRQNPKAREFVFESRDNIHIIDLGKTKEGLEESAQFLLETAKKPESTLLIVGTKRQAVPIIEEELHRVKGETPLGVFTVTKRWMGGTLTNTLAIGKNYARLKELREKLNTEEWKAKYTKRELMLFEREMQKLEAYYAGIADMKKLPDALFIVDTHTEDLAVKEARRMRIPSVGIVDTNADPDLVDYVIPANDDAVGSLKLLIGYILDAWVEGKTGKSPKGASDKVAAEVKATKETKAEEKIEPVIASEGTETKQSPEEKEKLAEKKIVAKKSSEKKEKKG